MKYRLVAFAVLAALALNASPIWAGVMDKIKKDGIMRICNEPGYMPFEMINKDGALVGFDIDLAALITQELGAKPEWVNTAWADIIPALLNDKCDIIMSGMSITEERRQKIDFTNAYVIIGQTVLLRKELGDKVKTYTDLNDPKYKVIAKAATTSEEAVKRYLPKAQHIFLAKEDDGVLEVLNGKADAFIYDSPYNTVAFGKQGQGKLVFLDSPFTSEPIGFAIRKNEPEFLTWLNQFLDSIKNTKRYALYKKWFKKTDWLKDMPSPSS